MHYFGCRAISRLSYDASNCKDLVVSNSTPGTNPKQTLVCDMYALDGLCDWQLRAIEPATSRSNDRESNEAVLHHSPVSDAESCTHSSPGIAPLSMFGRVFGHTPAPAPAAAPAQPAKSLSDSIAHADSRHAHLNAKVCSFDLPNRWCFPPGVRVHASIAARYRFAVSEKVRLSQPSPRHPLPVLRVIHKQQKQIHHVKPLSIAGMLRKALVPMEARKSDTLDPASLHHPRASPRDACHCNLWSQITECNRQLAAMNMQFRAARAPAQKRMIKQKMMQVLTRRKGFEKQATNMMAVAMRMEATSFAIESASMAVEQVATMKEQVSPCSSKQLHHDMPTRSSCSCGRIY